MVITPVGKVSRLRPGTNDDYFRNAVANINIKHRFDSTGTELRLIGIKGGIVIHRCRIMRTSFINLTKQIATDYVSGATNKETATLKTAKGDIYNLQKKDRLEAGFKTSFVF